MKRTIVCCVVGSTLSSLAPAVIQAAAPAPPAAAAPAAPVIPPKNAAQTHAILKDANLSADERDLLLKNSKVNFTKADVLAIAGITAVDALELMEALQKYGPVARPAAPADPKTPYNATDTYAIAHNNTLSPMQKTDLLESRHVKYNETEVKAVPGIDVPTATDLIKYENQYGVDKRRTPYKVFFSTGAKFLNPESVTVDTTKTPPTGTLTNAGSSTVPFLEFSYINRFVFRDEDYDDDAFGKTKSHSILGSHFIWPWKKLPDFEAHVGYTFQGNQPANQYSASAIAGSGDSYGGVNVGFPVWRYGSARTRHQVTLELGGGAITDKGFAAIHPDGYAGIGYSTGFIFPQINGKEGSGFYLGRIAYGVVDMPRLTDTGVELSSRGGSPFPRFDLEWAPILSSYIVFPITDGVFLTLGGNAYLRDNPTAWNITVGVSIPVGKFGEMIAPLFTDTTQSKQPAP